MCSEVIIGADSAPTQCDAMRNCRATVIHRTTRPAWIRFRGLLRTTVSDHREVGVFGITFGQKYKWTLFQVER